MLVLGFGEEFLAHWMKFYRSKVIPPIPPIHPTIPTNYDTASKFRLWIQAANGAY